MSINMTNTTTDTREFDGKGHLIGCSEWARLWERHWGRAALDRATLVNLDAMHKRGRAECCRPPVATTETR